MAFKVLAGSVATFNKESGKLPKGCIKMIKLKQALHEISLAQLC